MSTLRELARKWLEDAVPDKHVVTSDGKPFVVKPGEPPLELVPNSAKRFVELTGWTHKQLTDSWDAQALIEDTTKRRYKTTCNEFTGKFGDAMGLGHLAAIDPHHHLKKELLYAWVSPGKGAVPHCGDIVQLITDQGYHVFVSLSLNGDEWISVDAGQGGPKRKHDVIKRVTRSFGKSHLEGWIDIEAYRSVRWGVRPDAERSLADLRGLWFGEDGNLIHPDAPAGRGGAGGFRVAGSVTVDRGSLDLWHPDAPADRYLGPLGAGDAAHA